MYTIDISSYTYLLGLVNVVKERPVDKNELMHKHAHDFPRKADFSCKSIKLHQCSTGV